MCSSDLMSAQIYAMAKKGNATRERLCTFAKGFVADNGFHLNGDFKNYGFSQWHYRPFTLESLFGYCDALQEMLMQEHEGYLHLFPVMPDKWKTEKITFKKLRTYGGVEVSATCHCGKTTGAGLRLPRKMTVKIKNTFGADVLLVRRGDTTTECVAKDGYFYVEGARGAITLTPKTK